MRDSSRFFFLYRRALDSHTWCESLHGRNNKREVDEPIPISRRLSLRSSGFPTADSPRDFIVQEKIPARANLTRMF